MAYTKSQIKKSMDAKRRKFLKEASTSKEVFFGNDALVLKFAVEHYYDQYKAWHGNYPNLREVSYDDYYDSFARKSDYDDMMDILKEDYSNSKSPTVKWLIDTAKELRKRYFKR